MIAYARKLTNRQGVDTWWDIYPSEMQVRMCFGKAPEPIYKVELVENENGPFWAWEDSKKPGFFSMVYDSKTLLDICFPYGPEAEVKRGNGRIVRLQINEV